MNMKQIIFALLPLLLIACGSNPFTESQTAQQHDDLIHFPSETVQFISEHGAVLSATFENGHRQVTVTLPDGKVSQLPHVTSASGVRYSDGRETFWVYGDEASFWQVNRRLFQGKMKSR